MWKNLIQGPPERQNHDTTGVKNQLVSIGLPKEMSESDLSQLSKRILNLLRSIRTCTNCKITLV